MPISLVQTTDNFSQWVQKTNEAITKVNSLLATGTVLSINAPQAGQLLVYNGSEFRNVAMSGDVIINSNGVTTVVSGGAGTKKGRLFFAGSMRAIY